mmetsp:Transcript_24016/g.20999  ORF Transcript_24016/g.20999 Transcript_24016/m.20999 type:complete len:132 (-) Transcript_24016:41-436(-)
MMIKSIELLFLSLSIFTQISLSYFMVETASDRLDAISYCESRESTLATIHSLDDNDKAKDACTGYVCWIGLERPFAYWIDDSRVNFTNWEVAEPNNSGGNENCAQIVVGNGKWNDIRCDDKSVYPVYPLCD